MRINTLHIKILKIFSILFCIFFAQLVLAFPIQTENDDWDYTMRTIFKRDFDLFESFNATDGFRERQNIYRNTSKFSTGLNAQSTRIYLGLKPNEDTIESDYKNLFNAEDIPDFSWSAYVRLLYLDINKSLIDSDQKDQIINALGASKFWFTESKEINNDIIYTENHQILCWTAEYLIGQLFPNDTFTYSDMTGKDHIKHASKLIIKWLDWRMRFGFSEWNSNNYLNPDITSLVNLVDFALDEEIAVKAAMILDQIAFGFACNYYKNRFATSQGRCYDDRRILTSSDGISEPAWIMLGLGAHNPCENNDRAAVALATSDHYAPPPILEDIADNASEYFEHKERHNIYMDEGDKYNIDYNDIEDINLWWGMSGPMAPEVIEYSFELLEKYSIDPAVVLGPQVLVDYIKIIAFLKGLSVSDYSKTIESLTRGPCLEAANIYTYRTPYYQLSGAQDHMKGLNGMQEHIWQASLDDSAYVFTNSPGGITKNFNQLWMGGFKPKFCAYENVGIIQYDRELLPLEAEIIILLLNIFTDNKPINHAYFPKNNFDEVRSQDGWYFGEKDDGYLGLYSYEPAFWASEYELRVNGFKNVWIIELGSKEEYGSFDEFIDQILDAKIKIQPEEMGYDISYKSPSQGKMTVSWDDPFYVDGKKIDLGDYPRFENEYCYQEFNSKRTVIEFEDQRLELNYHNNTRLYQNFS